MTGHAWGWFFQYPNPNTHPPGVALGVGVTVGVAEGVGVTVGVGVAEGVGVGLGVTEGVGVGVGVPPGQLPFTLNTIVHVRETNVRQGSRISHAAIYRAQITCPSLWIGIRTDKEQVAVELVHPGSITSITNSASRPAAVAVIGTLNMTVCLVRNVDRSRW